MIVIIESGATKSDWRVLESGREERFTLPGMNVSSMSIDYVSGIIAQAKERINGPVTNIYLYIAGVVTDQIKGSLTEALKALSTEAGIDIQSDMIAAARAVCGKGNGIVAILGTGSNSCQYENGVITRQVRSGGYILGDEGSAATLGRLFISDFIKGLVPAEVAQDFASKYPSDYASIVQSVYHSEGSPSAYLGSFAPFILSHKDNPYVKALIERNFRDFIDRVLKQYDTDKYPVGIVGGFGNACKDIFEPLAAASGIKISGFFPEPADLLVEYHLKG